MHGITRSWAFVGELVWCFRRCDRVCSYIASSMLCSALPPQLLNIFLCVLRMDVLHIFIYAAANIDYIYIMPNFLFSSVAERDIYFGG